MKRSPNLPRLSKEKVLKAADLNEAAARFLVSDYYRAQELRNSERVGSGESIE